MCLAVLLMPVMNAIAKALTVDYPLAQAVWARFTGHFICMTLLFWPGRGWRLFASARPSVVSPYGYGELLVAALLGCAIFGDFPDEWTWLGAAVIAASGVYIAYREGVLGRPGGR